MLAAKEGTKEFFPLAALSRCLPKAVKRTVLVQAIFGAIPGGVNGAEIVTVFSAPAGAVIGRTTGSVIAVTAAIIEEGDAPPRANS